MWPGSMPASQRSTPALENSLRAEMSGLENSLRIEMATLRAEMAAMRAQFHSDVLMLVAHGQEQDRRITRLEEKAT